MPLFILGLILTVGVVLLARGFLLAAPRLLAQCLRWTLGLVLVLFVLLSLEGGRVGAPLLLALLAAPLVLWRRWRRQSGGGATGGGLGGRSGTGRTSRVETRVLHMTLDHDTGALSGRVASGRFAGRGLEELGFDEVLVLLDECRLVDRPSIAVLEAWLDRVHGADWRIRAGAGAGGAAAAEGGGVLTRAEALAILGLEAGAGPEAIREAHRRLMARLHPDHGGSTWLAAKLNQARDMLLKSSRPVE